MAMEHTRKAARRTVPLWWLIVALIGLGMVQSHLTDPGGNDYDEEFLDDFQAR